MATGLLEDAIQENLDIMIVTDGEFNNASIRRALDLKYPSAMKKPTSIEYIFKDRAKFDVQNPVIGSLYNQITAAENKKKEKALLQTFSKAPTIKDIDIGRRLRELRDFNDSRRNDDDDDDDDDGNRGNNSGLKPPPLPSIPLSSSTPRLSRGEFPPTPPPSCRDDSSPSSSLTATQRFLLQRPQSERVAEAEAIGQEPGSSGPTASRVIFSERVQRIFPDSSKIIEETIEEEPSILDEMEIDDNEDNSEVQSAVQKLSKGETPKGLKFFSGGEQEGQTLIANERKNVCILNEINEYFLEYLSSSFGRNLSTKNKMKIHIETSQIFHDNQITGESLFDFLHVQEDITKKLLKVNIAISDNFEFYVREVLLNITDDRNDTNSNSTSKLLFYHFNTLRQGQGKSFYKIRHSVITADTVALGELQKRDWQYFIVTLLEISNKEYERGDLTDTQEKDY